MLCHTDIIILFQGSTEFTVEDLLSSTTYSFNILAFNEKGESDYTSDNVMKTTEAAPVDTKDDSPSPPAPPAPEPPSYSRILMIIAGIGGGLLVCNMALLYCYVQRKKGRNIFGSDDSTMSRSSILEMYFSNSSGRDSRSDSQSINSDVDDTLNDDFEDDNDSATMDSRDIVDMWRQRDQPKPHAIYPGRDTVDTRYPGTSVRYPEPGHHMVTGHNIRTTGVTRSVSRYSEYSPSPPPWPQENRRKINY